MAIYTIFVNAFTCKVWYSDGLLSIIREEIGWSKRPNIIGGNAVKAILKLAITHLNI